MKKNLRFAIVVFLILAMLLAVSPASAGAVKTPVTGTATFLGEPDNPNYRVWFSGGEKSYIGHFRYAYQVYEVKTDDTRLNGWQMAVISGEWFFKPDGTLDIHTWDPSSTIYADSQFTIPAWKCSSNGQFGYAADWSYLGGVVNVVCTGLGDNEGLLAHITLSQSPGPESAIYDLTGFILAPGG